MGGMVELWSCRMVKWRSSGVDELLNGGIVELSNRRMVQFWRCGYVEL